MTPTEISQAYAELHDKWPELRPDVIDDNDVTNAACFLACLKACGDRGCDVAFPADWGDPKFYETVTLVHVNIANPHTITEVMDRVMQLPKVGA